MKWEVQPEFEGLLIRVLQDAGEPVKISSATTVTRHRLAGRAFYVKQYLHNRRGLAPFAYFIRSAKSQREWKLAPQFQARGVAVVPHLAHGERWGWYGLLESALITEGLPGYGMLVEIADANATEIQSALGAFLRQMHDAGILYLDISPKNVLYSRAERRFCVLDIDKVELHSAIDDDRRAAHLAVFHARFPLTDAFYQGYGGAMVRRANEIGERAKAVRAAIAAQQARRCLKHTHEVDTKRIGGLTWRIRRTCSDAHLEKILQDPNAQDSATNGFIITTRRFHSAKQAYREAYRRERLGETAPRPVAAADKRLFGFVVRSYFVAKTP